MGKSYGDLLMIFKSFNVDISIHKEFLITSYVTALSN